MLKKTTGTQQNLRVELTGTDDFYTKSPEQYSTPSEPKQGTLRHRLVTNNTVQALSQRQHQCRCKQGEDGNTGSGPKDQEDKNGGEMDEHGSSKGSIPAEQVPLNHTALPNHPPATDHSVSRVLFPLTSIQGGQHTTGSETRLPKDGITLIREKEPPSTELEKTDVAMGVTSHLPRAKGSVKSSNRVSARVASLTNMVNELYNEDREEDLLFAEIDELWHESHHHDGSEGRANGHSHDGEEHSVSKYSLKFSSESEGEKAKQYLVRRKRTASDPDKQSPTKTSDESWYPQLV